MTAPPLRRNRAFQLLWLGEGASVLGNATTAVLLPLLAVVTLDAGPGWMGALTAAAWLPWLVAGLPAGAWVDRLPPRGVMIASDLAAAGIITSVPVAYAAGFLTLPHLLVAALGNGLCSVFFRAAYPALISQVAPPEEQESVFARLFGTDAAMQVAGPGLGGLLAQAITASWGLLVDALSYVVSAACLWRMRPLYAAEPATDDPASLLTRIREGVAFIRHDRYLRVFTVVGGLSNFGLTGYQTLLVLFLVRDLDLSALMVGLVLALGSIGGLVGAGVATRVSSRLGSARALLAMQIVGGMPALLVPLASPGAGIAALVLGLVLVGIGVVAGNVIRAGWRNRYVPASMMARQVTTASFVNYGTMPLAALAAGWLGSQLGVRTTIAIMAAVHAAACISMLWSPLRGLREMPERSAEARELSLSGA